MNKQTILLILGFIGLLSLQIYDTIILHASIKKVRKEAWFTTHERGSARMRSIEEYVEYLENRISHHHGKHPAYPNGYPLWEKQQEGYEKEKNREKDPLIELLIDKSL